jgi:predicted nucleotidyltransferase component of viral defense system
MIDKKEILDVANSTNLSPHVVEKDYALGWALAGINAHERLRDQWVFKGGTCLKKCYFETYRFSEDLDFTLKDEAHLNEQFLQDCFSEISEWVYEQSGLEFPADQQKFDIYTNPRGSVSCQAKLSYRGPVSPRSGGLPRIKLDLLADECLVLPGVSTSVFHPYSDGPENGIEILSYAYEEVFAEKVRALGERTKPRDLYDVINLYRNTEARPDASVILNVLKQKCDYKGISVPEYTALEPHRSDLEGAWESMLAHQLPALPSVASFWDVLQEFFRWLHEGIETIVPQGYALESGETIIRERSLGLPLSTALRSYLEIIRFGAANRLSVSLNYGGTSRHIEPYSLRRTKDDNYILHAWNIDSDAHRSYRIDRIQGANITAQSFAPRYEVELTPTGTLPIKDTERTSDFEGLYSRPLRRQSRRSRTVTKSTYGPTHVYQCSACGKKFRRKTMNGKLNKHKNPAGYDCFGRTGFFVETKY